MQGNFLLMREILITKTRRIIIFQYLIYRQCKSVHSLDRLFIYKVICQLNSSSKQAYLASLDLRVNALSHITYRGNLPSRLFDYMGLHNCTDPQIPSILNLILSESV